MHTLLSLPPNVVSTFHEITGLTPNEWFCTHDPIDRKLGSGGGSAWLLNACHEATEPATPFNKWISQEKRILLHAGGQSRRLPCYAPSGKVLTPIPMFRWESGQRIDQTLLDLQMPLYNRILDKAPQGLHTLIASGDVYIRTSEPLQDIPEADVVCYGLWAEPTTISHHGVFLLNRDNPHTLDFVLQKPTLEQQAQLMQTHYSLMDIGIWLLSDRAVELLMRKSKTQQGEIGFYDLYSDFGQALGTHPTKHDAELQSLSVAILPLQGGEFYHFGTAPELLSSAMAIQNIVKDQRQIIQLHVKRQPSLFTQNSLIRSHFDETNEYIWVENSCVPTSWTLSHHHIITGVPVNDWTISLPPHICIDVVPIGKDGMALRPYGYFDTFRGSATDEGTLFMGKPWKSWLNRHGLKADDIKGSGDIQSASLFPVVNTTDELKTWLQWFLDDKPNQEMAQKYLELTRLSADELQAKANLPRLVAQRRTFGNECLTRLSKNWKKSIFYQANLKDMAQKFATAGLPLPEELPEDAPLLTKIHDAMFRAEVERLQGNPESERLSSKAFGYLRDGLTADVLKHRSSPRLNVFRDQIVWGRSPVRIDLAGGWTDTPPFSLTAGGNVVNVAIELNGQPPLQVYIKPCSEPIIVCRSIDLGAIERIETYEELKQYNKVGSPFSIPKAALTLAGFLPGFGTELYDTLRHQLEDFGAGIEITLLSAIPAGSGLGTSSILAATVLGAISDFCALEWDANEICHRTLVLEQLLTTGGGWQDQYGGVLPGLKLLQTQSGFRQDPVTRYLPDAIFTKPELEELHILYYTGVTRTAKHILAEIVRGMFLNNSEHLELLHEMKQHAIEMFEVLQRIDLDGYGRLLRKTWKQNQMLDCGTNPPVIAKLCQQIDDLCAGYKLPGAGGGGYLYMLAKDEVAARRIRTILSENPLGPNARFVNMSVSTKGMQVSRS